MRTAAIPFARTLSTRPCTYEACGKDFTPARPLQSVCSQRCATRKAQAAVKAREEAAKVERAKDRARWEAIKPISEWEDECRQIVQKIARIRDRDDGCISCHLPATWGGQWHGSHFRSVGACSALQLHLWNIHKACSGCNYHKGGNIINYRPRLVEKIGQDKVDWLEAQNQVTKRSGPEYVAYLKRFKKVMGKRARRMEKRYG